jgi:hypothetical protein
MNIDTVVALAGRRPDAPDTKIRRFPLDRVPAVRERIDQVLLETNAQALVSSAACGADLLALDVAGERHLKRRVVLPFSPTKFRRISVTDRPGDWGPVFDRIIREVKKTGDLVVLPKESEEDAAFAAANDRILAEATQTAATLTHSPSAPRLTAIVVWEGKAHGPNDATAGFRDAARRLGFTIVEIPTMDGLLGHDFVM